MQTETDPRKSCGKLHFLKFKAKWGNLKLLYGGRNIIRDHKRKINPIIRAKAIYKRTNDTTPYHCGYCSEHFATAIAFDQKIIELKAQSHETNQRSKHDSLTSPNAYC